LTNLHLAQAIFQPFHGDSKMNSTVSGRRSFLRVSTVAAGLALLATAAVTPAIAAAKNAKGTDGVGAKALVGTWRVSVTTYRNCDPLQPNPSFDSLLTFGEDGSLIETTSSAQFQAGQRSIGHGRWERTGPGAFRAVSEAFIQFATTSSLPPPPPGPALQRGRQRIDQGIEMTSRDTFESDASVFFFGNTSDNGVAPYFSGCAKASGVRFE
jgi:hypothetical protein